MTKKKISKNREEFQQNLEGGGKFSGWPEYIPLLLLNFFTFVTDNLFHWSVCKLVGKSVKISFSLVLFIYRDEWQFERNGPWAPSHPHAELLPRPNCTQPNYSHQENVYLNRNVQTLRLKLTWTISYESTRSSHSEIGVQYPEDVNVEKNLKNQSTSASLYHSLPRTIRFFFTNGAVLALVACFSRNFIRYCFFFFFPFL